MKLFKAWDVYHVFFYVLFSNTYFQSMYLASLLNYHLYQKYDFMHAFNNQKPNNTAIVGFFPFHMDL